MKKVSLKKAVELNKQSIQSHIGSGDQAHLPVSSEHAGFMTPDLLHNQQLASGNRQWLDVGTDVQTLAPGHYVGTDIQNSAFPDSPGAIVLVDVTDATGVDGSDYRQIVQMLSVNGEIRVMNLHGKSTLTPKGYSTIERVEPLWTGSVDTVGTTLTLADTIANMSAVRVTTDNGGGGVKTTVIPKPKSVSALVAGIEDTNITTNGDSASVFEMSISLNNNTAKITTNTVYDIKQQLQVKTGLMKVLSIEGVF